MSDSHMPPCGVTGANLFEQPLILSIHVNSKGVFSCDRRRIDVVNQNRNNQNVVVSGNMGMSRLPGRQRPHQLQCLCWIGRTVVADCPVKLVPKSLIAAGEPWNNRGIEFIFAVVAKEFVHMVRHIEDSVTQADQNRRDQDGFRPSGVYCREDLAQIIEPIGPVSMSWKLKRYACKGITLGVGTLLLSSRRPILRRAEFPSDGGSSWNHSMFANSSAIAISRSGPLAN